MRAARRADVDAIARVHVASWRAAYRGLLPNAYLADLSIAGQARRWRDRLRNVTAREAILVAERAGAVVGFASAGPTRDPDCDADTTGELYAIYADPPAWSSGVGRALHGAALTSLRSAGFTTATLWVLDTNERARRFYEKAGWAADGATKVESYGVRITEARYRRDV